MADPLLVDSDLELFLIGFYTVQLAALAAAGESVVADFDVDRVEPEPGTAFPAKLLVVRDDSGPGGLLTRERAIGLSVLMGNIENPADAKRAAAVVMGLIWQAPTAVLEADVRNPVAAVTETNGPYMVPESQDRARVYGTATLMVTPELL